MESFKRLDKLCRDMFNSDKGVTTYIDLMECKYDGYRYVSDWKYTLKSLKEIRHKRNQYAHEVGASYENIFTKQDIKWLEDFYRSILNGTDPLATYEKAHRARKSNTAVNRNTSQKTRQKSKNHAQ